MVFRFRFFRFAVWGSLAVSALSPNPYHFAGVEEGMGDDDGLNTL